MKKIGIPNDTEIIIVDDGSEPPLKYKGSLPVTILATNDKRKWTWALARNAGARSAKGEYLFMFDIDHIITKECIEMARTFGGYKIQFKREFGVLTKDGNLTQDLETLVDYGFPLERLKTRGLTLSPLPNNFVMRKDIFWELGGYVEDRVERSYPQGEDRLFKKEWNRWMERTGGNVHTERCVMYMFPNGKTCGDVDFNPFGLFHDTTRKTRTNHWYWKQKKENK
jgi:hypothetical protein